MLKTVAKPRKGTFLVALKRAFIFTIVKLTMNLTRKWRAVAQQTPVKPQLKTLVKSRVMPRCAREAIDRM